MELDNFINQTQSWDEKWILKLNSLGGKSATYLLKIISFFGRETLWFFLIAYFIFIWYDPLPFVYIGTTFLNGLLIILPIKEGIKRNRPFDTLDAIEVLEQKPTSKSFPSWHSYNTTSQALTIAYLVNSPLLAIILLVFSILVAFSRIQLGVHYPSDVIVGYICGILGFLLMYYLLGPLFLNIVLFFETIAIHDIYSQQINPNLSTNGGYILACVIIFGFILASSIYKPIKARLKK